MINDKKFKLTGNIYNTKARTSLIRKLQYTRASSWQSLCARFLFHSEINGCLMIWKVFLAYNVYNLSKLIRCLYQLFSQPAVNKVTLKYKAKLNKSNVFSTLINFNALKRMDNLCNSLLIRRASINKDVLNSGESLVMFTNRKINSLLFI